LNFARAFAASHIARFAIGVTTPALIATLARKEFIAIAGLSAVLFITHAQLHGEIFCTLAVIPTLHLRDCCFEAPHKLQWRSYSFFLSDLLLLANFLLQLL